MPVGERADQILELLHALRMRLGAAQEMHAAAESNDETVAELEQRIAALESELSQEWRASWTERVTLP